MAESSLSVAPGISPRMRELIEQVVRLQLSVAGIERLSHDTRVRIAESRNELLMQVRLWGQAPAINRPVATRVPIIPWAEWRARSLVEEWADT